MIILEYLSRASSLLGTVAYPAADAAVAFTAMYLVIQDKRTIHKQLSSSFSHIASAFLVILAASHYSGWTMTLNQVASLALPLLAVHPSGYTNFQFANALGIYRLLHNKGNPLQSALSILLHIYLVFANLNLSNQMQLASIMREISFAQVRQLNALQKLRELTIDDLWQLPERYQLRNAYSDLVINTTESFFLHKAIFRMVWKPLIPIQVARMLLQLLPIFRSIFNGHIYQCLDSSDSGGYYKAYMAAAGLILVEFLEGQRCYIRGFTTKEEDRMKGVLKLELARLPLIHSGLKKTPTPWEIELEITRGTGTLSGRVGYLEQAPWIMNDTMRANILFGREFEEDYYWKVVYACALTQDIELWPERDLSLIGERGINISGGQRARLALARTVYSRADFYILDDPLSAVDAHVKRHILDNVILSSGLLGNALRVVTTHSESMLPFCDQIVTISDKTVSVVRQEPKEHLYIAPVTIVKPNNDTDPTPKETNLATVPATPTTDGDDTKSDTIKAKPVAAANPTPAKKETLPKKHTILENAKYVFGLCGWHAIVTFVITASFRPLSNFVLDKYNIAALKENAKYSSVSHEAVLWYLKVRLFKNATSEILDRIENYIGLMLSGDRIEDAIQTKFVYSLLHAPLSFLEKANRFKISAAYNEGSRAMAHGIPRYLRTESANAFESMISLWRSAQATPQFMLIVPFIVWARTRASKITDMTSESLSSIEKEASSRHSQTSSIIKDGGRMIRLFGVESYYMSCYISDKDEEAQIDCPKDSLERLSEIVSNGIRDSGKLISLISIIIQSHLTKYKVSSGQLNVLRADVADLIYNTGMLVEMPSRLRKFSNEIGTFRQFSDLDPEAPYIVEDCRVPSEWPHSGNVEFKNLSVRYGADQDYALKNLNITIRPGEKIGIVGRTGAGKSTLAKTIFRLLDNEVEGSIKIDGHDTAQFGVGDFRPKLGIIPQESTMFYGTVRRNLDPLHEFTIEDMWAAMIKCGVAELIEPKRKRKSTGLAKELVSSGSKGEDKDGDEDKDEDEEADRLRWEKSGFLMRAVLFLFASKKPKVPSTKDTKVGVNLTLGPNDSRFSGGQRQLFSLCRLLMRKRKVLILDEATAEVDLETDSKMQKLIRSEFSECTVLTIAHRLDTIMNSDRIIVMEKGEIAEIGPPHELIANGGMFAELVKANEF
ncbi:Multidrug resistance-associated protein 1 [Coemansia sp. RSA 922]|nr:Multidrug resistance-associated protein 1 [Coemansia sp. RSA 922]